MDFITVNRDSGDLHVRARDVVAVGVAHDTHGWHATVSLSAEANGFVATATHHDSHDAAADDATALAGQVEAVTGVALVELGTTSWVAPARIVSVATRIARNGEPLVEVFLDRTGNGLGRGTTVADVAAAHALAASILERCGDI